MPPQAGELTKEKSEKITTIFYCTLRSLPAELTGCVCVLCGMWCKGECKYVSERACMGECKYVCGSVLIAEILITEYEFYKIHR